MGFAPSSDLLTIDADNGNLRVSPGDVDRVEVARWTTSGSRFGPPQAAWPPTDPDSAHRVDATTGNGRIRLLTVPD